MIRNGFFVWNLAHLNISILSEDRFIDFIIEYSEFILYDVFITYRLVSILMYVLFLRH